MKIIDEAKPYTKQLNNTMTRSDIFKSIIYGILGFIFSIGGIIGLVYPDANIPNNINEVREILHATMELASAIIPIGFLLIWSAFNVRKTIKLNYFYLLFFLLFSGVHWYEFLIGNRQVLSPLFNSIPMILIIIVILLPSSLKKE